MGEQTAAPAVEDARPAKNVPDGGVRGLVLYGIRPGPGIVEPWSGFLLADGPEALARWFGDAAAGKDAASLRHAIDRDILAIDRMIATQLDAILHHRRIQALEASWRGLRWLVEQIEDGPGDRIVVRLLSASWREIARDMERAAEFDQSNLFRRIYEAEFGMAGGEPFGLLLVDHAVRHQPDRDNPIDDKAVLEHLAQIGAAAFAPVLLAAALELLGVRSFAELAATARPATVLADRDHRRWRDLGDRPDSRFLGVVLPRVLARAPWPDDGSRGDGFRYRETADAVEDRLWMSGAYPFAAVVARAAARFAWPADIRGTDTDRIGGGLVTDLPAEPHRLSQTLALPRLPVEVVFTDGQERMLTEAGLIPLGALPHTDALMFGAVRSLYRPPRLAEPAGSAAFADSRVVTQMNALLCACRFAHFLKIRGRQTIGRLRRPEDIEFELRGWLTGFVNRNTTSTAETRAARPLYDASVRVTERADKPGVFDCWIDLQPYFQLDNVTASFNFQTEIMPPAA
jgi:type VI secretion system protein ImpD/type VI secretion system protein ImpC